MLLGQCKLNMPSCTMPWQNETVFLFFCNVKKRADV